MAAYHVGVYQALQEAGMEPDWLVGTGFGALNGAIIAGNPLVRRLSTLNELWASIEQNSPVDALAARRLEVPNLGSIGEGVPGVFLPNINAALGLDVSVAPASLYTLDRLRDWLSREVDFARLNDGGTRLSLGAVNVRTGNTVLFDGTDRSITREHVLASVAMPPFFPSVDLDGEAYWSAELVGSIALRYIEDDDWSRAQHDIIVFAVVPGSPRRKELPKTLREVLLQQKNIRDSSGNRAVVNTLKHVRRKKSC